MRRINDLPIRSKFILLYLLGVLLPIAGMASAACAFKLAASALRAAMLSTIMRSILWLAEFSRGN